MVAHLLDSEKHIGEVGGAVLGAFASFTRPADTTAYASGDLASNSTTAALVQPLELVVARKPRGSGMVRRVKLEKSGTSVTASSFRIHFYGSLPSVVNGDNAAWSTPKADYLGAVDITIAKAFSDGAAGYGVPEIGAEINYYPATGKSVWCLIEARDVYTPASAEVFTVTVEALPN